MDLSQYTIEQLEHLSLPKYASCPLGAGTPAVYTSGNSSSHRELTDEGTLHSIADLEYRRAEFLNLLDLGAEEASERQAESYDVKQLRHLGSSTSLPDRCCCCDGFTPSAASSPAAHRSLAFAVAKIDDASALTNRCECGSELHTHIAWTGPLAEYKIFDNDTYADDPDGKYIHPSTDYYYAHHKFPYMQSALLDTLVYQTRYMLMLCPPLAYSS